MRNLIANLKFKLMIRLLKWYGGKEMDQHDYLKLHTQSNPVYVFIGLEPIENTEPQEDRTF